MHQSVVKPTIEMFGIDLNKYIYLTYNIDLEFLALCLAGHGGCEVWNDKSFWIFWSSYSIEIHTKSVRYIQINILEKKVRTYRR